MENKEGGEAAPTPMKCFLLDDLPHAKWEELVHVVQCTYIHDPKLPLGHIYMLTVGSVLTTNVSQTSLCQLLFRATIKVRLDSCLSLLLEWTTLTAPK